MPNLHKPIDNVASQLSEKSVREFSFTKLDLKNTYSQLKKTSRKNNVISASVEEIWFVDVSFSRFFGLADIIKMNSK